MSRNARASGPSAKRCSATPASTPKTKHPTMLTTKVPNGKYGVVNRWTTPASPYRATAPMDPPSAISNRFIETGYTPGSTIADCRLQIADSGLKIDEWRLRVESGDELPIADCRFAIADSSVDLRLHPTLAIDYLVRLVATRPQNGRPERDSTIANVHLSIADSDRQSALAIVTRQSSTRESPISNLQSSVLQSVHSLTARGTSGATDDSARSTSMLQSLMSATSAPMAASVGARTAPTTPAVSGNSATMRDPWRMRTRRTFPS